MTLNLQGKTFAGQSSIPKLPIPPLEDTCNRYLRALEGLQDPVEHARTKAIVEEFLKGEGPRLQEKLKAYAADKARWVHRSSDLKGVILADKPYPSLPLHPATSKSSGMNHTSVTQTQSFWLSIRSLS